MTVQDLIFAIDKFNEEPKPLSIEELKHIKKLEKQNKVDIYVKKILEQEFYKITIDDEGNFSIEGGPNGRK